MNEGPVKVLYIGGTGRTGSTIVEKILGQDPKWFAGGELTFLWRFLHSGKCSCGEPLTGCPVWTAVFRDAFGGFDAVDADEMVRLRHRFRSVHLPVLASTRLRRRFLTRLGHFPHTIERLYRSIAGVSGANVVVDSSKEPHYSWILQTRGALDVHFLHLVRDPRAIAHSWQRSRAQLGLDTGELMERRGALRASAYFDVSNAAAEAIWARRPERYLRMRYEDFVEDPDASLRAIEDFVHEPVPVRERFDGRSIDLEEVHSAWGNPNRFGAGPVDLRTDAEWATRMGPVELSVVTALTLPFVTRYGYSLRTGQRRVRRRRDGSPRPHR